MAKPGASMSWRIVRANPSLLRLAAVGALVQAAIFGCTIAMLAVVGFDRRDGLIVLAVVVYPFTVAATFCEVALVAAVRGALDGKELTVAEALAAARRRLPLILRWSLVTATIGMAIQVLETVRGGVIVYRVLGWFLELAWAAATYLAVPVLVFEGVGPIETLKRSGTLVRERWGTGLRGAVRITVVSALVALPFWLLIGVGVVAMLNGYPATGALVAAAGAVGVAAVLALTTAVASTFRVVLYLYASEGIIVDGFDRFTLDTAFRRT
ncbi:MAG: hypothetical protein QOE29_287 [Gaiellaceae bacterium]|jgi:hypothetical protein|nr:hypothetical protein [Gaiellaceae bacterium]